MVREPHDIVEIISINLGFLAVSLTFHNVGFDVVDITCSDFLFVCSAQSIKKLPVFTPYCSNPYMNGI